MSKEAQMAADQDDNLPIDENEDLVEGTAAAESLHPNTHKADDSMSKVEAMAKIVSAAQSLPVADLCKWYEGMISQYPNVGTKGQDKSGANKSSINLKAGGTPSAPMPMIKIKEDVDKLFEGESLTEEAKEKITTLFESAVSLRVSLIETELTEAYEKALTEEVETFIAETEDNVAAYIEYAVDRWITENEVAVVDSLRLENAEDFMEKLRGLFLESNIAVPEGQMDVVEELTGRVDTVEAELEKTLAENLELKAALVEAARQETLDDLKEGLTLADAEKLDTLVESVEFTSPEDYAKKVELIREKHFPTGAKKTNEGVETLNETSLTPAEQVVYQDPLIEAAVQAMNRGVGVR